MAIKALGLGLGFNVVGLLGLVVKGLIKVRYYLGLGG